MPFAWAKATDVWGDLPVGGSIDNAKGTPEELKAQLDALIDDGSCLRYDGAASDDFDDDSLALGNGQRSAPHRLLVHETREHLPRFIGGTPTHNIRSGDFLVGDQIYSADDIDLLYVQLSNGTRLRMPGKNQPGILGGAQENWSPTYSNGRDHGCGGAELTLDGRSLPIKNDPRFGDHFGDKFWGLSST